MLIITKIEEWIFMMTHEKVLEVFAEYLAQDGSYEVLDTRRGLLVVDWNSCHNEWVTSQLCPTPEKLLSVLRSSYEEYQGYRLTDGYKRDLTSQEQQDIKRMGAELAARCEGGGT